MIPIFFAIQKKRESDEALSWASSGLSMEHDGWWILGVQRKKDMVLEESIKDGRSAIGFIKGLPGTYVHHLQGHSGKKL